MVDKPSEFVGDALARIEAWAASHGVPAVALAEAHERFADWVPQSGKQRRTWNQWVGAFLTIARGVLDKPTSGLVVQNGHRLSPAQAKEQRIREAMVEAARMPIGEFFELDGGTT